MNSCLLKSKHEEPADTLGNKKSPQFMANYMIEERSSFFSFFHTLNTTPAYVLFLLRSQYITDRGCSMKEIPAPCHVFVANGIFWEL